MSTQHSNDRRSGSAGIWKIMAGVLALVVIGLIAYLILGRHDSPGTTPTQATSATPATSSTAPVTPAVPATSETTSQAPTPTTSTAVDSSWADTGCNGTTGSTGNPATALAQVTWKPFLTTSIPSSPVLGPTKTSTVVRTCYQHSPAGAVMAATNIALGMFASNGGQVIEQQWTAGPGRDAALKAASEATSPAAIAAYRLDGCDAQACNVNLVASASGQYVQDVVPMVWQGGDWKVDGSRVRPDGHLITGIPVGFTAWGSSS